MAQPTGFEPASARSTIESSRLLSYGCTLRGVDFAPTQILVGVEGFEPSMLQELRVYGPVGQPVAPTHPTLGGDDPIRTDGALRGRAALAVRHLRPLGHVSMNLLVGMERFELPCSKALVSKTSVSPISTTSPLITCSVISHTSSNQASNRCLLAQLLNKVSIKQKPLDFSRGFCGSKELCLNQPHPSMPSRSLSDSDRYDLNRFFTKTRIPQFQKKRN